MLHRAASFSPFDLSSAATTWLDVDRWVCARPDVAWRLHHSELCPFLSFSFIESDTGAVSLSVLRFLSTTMNFSWLRSTFKAFRKLNGFQSSLSFLSFTIYCRMPSPCRWGFSGKHLHFWAQYTRMTGNETRAPLVNSFTTCANEHGRHCIPVSRIELVVLEGRHSVHEGFCLLVGSDDGVHGSWNLSSHYRYLFCWC